MEIWSSGVDASTVMDLDETIAALLGDAVQSTVVGQTVSASAGAIFEMLLFNDFSLLEISFARSFYIWETFNEGRFSITFAGHTPLTRPRNMKSTFSSSMHTKRGSR